MLADYPQGELQKKEKNHGFKDQMLIYNPETIKRNETIELEKKSQCQQIDIVKK